MVLAVNAGAGINQNVAEVPSPAVAEAVSNFSNALECPVMLTLLKDAVLLTPCGHTISEVAAKNLYGAVQTIEERETVEKVAPCPLCRRNVVAYYPNHAMRSLVAITLGTKVEEVLPVVSASVQAAPEKDLDTIPFPGVAAKFVLRSGSWEPFESGAALVRQLTFTSATEGSLFEEMGLLGYKDGRIALQITFKENRTAASQYLLDCGLKLDFIATNCGFYVSRTNDTKLLFRILAKHNEIPKEHFMFIRDLVTSGNWKKESQPVGDQ